MDKMYIYICNGQNASYATFSTFQTDATHILRTHAAIPTIRPHMQVHTCAYTHAHIIFYTHHTCTHTNCMYTQILFFNVARWDASFLHGSF